MVLALTFCWRQFPDLRAVRRSPSRASSLAELRRQKLRRPTKAVAIFRDNMDKKELHRRKALDICF